MNAHEWIVSVCGNDSNREIARKAKLSDATLSRQITKDALTFDVVIAIARGYETSVVAALVANDYITEAEASIDSLEAALQNASDQQLVDEVHRRIVRGSEAYDRPVTATRKRNHLRAVDVPGPEHHEEDLPAVARPAETENTDEQ